MAWQNESNRISIISPGSRFPLPLCLLLSGWLLVNLIVPREKLLVEEPQATSGNGRGARNGEGGLSLEAAPILIVGSATRIIPLAIIEELLMDKLVGTLLVTC